MSSYLVSPIFMFDIKKRKTNLHLQAFANNIEDASIDCELNSALQNAFKSVSVLTAWADSVIIEAGHMDAGTDFVEEIIEPVRRAVIIAVNCISVRVGHKSLSRGNSLPDITSDNLSLIHI